MGIKDDQLLVLTKRKVQRNWIIEWSKIAIDKQFKNEELKNELHKPITKKHKKTKSINGLNLECRFSCNAINIQTHRGVRFLLCFRDAQSKYFWDVPLKDKKDKTIKSI